MFAVSHRQPRTPGGQPPRRARRGVALVFVMVFVIAMAALAVSSIFMSSGTTLYAKSYDRERDLRYAAEVALAIGRTRITKSPGLLVLPPGVDYRQIMTNERLLGADNAPVPDVVVNVYIGLTGSSSGQNGRFASIIAQAVDTAKRASFVRRLELTQESFAKYAYWSDRESNSGRTIFFNNGDQLWGPVWSNDQISIGSGGATFNSDVGTAMGIDGQQFGTFRVAPKVNQKRITLPATDALSVLSSYAALGGLTVDARDGPSATETQVLDRIEFVAFDMDNSGDSTGVDEGFYRLYQGNVGTERAVRGDWVGNRDGDGYPVGIPTASAVEFCGDFHWMPMPNGTVEQRFYPASVHSQAWFSNQINQALISRNQLVPPQYKNRPAYVNAEVSFGSLAGGLDSILSRPGARCYLAGDPHLVAIDRGDAKGNPLPPYGAAQVQIGGDESTFTPVGRYGRWIAPAVPLPQAVLNRRPADGRYLYAIGHAWNPNGKGVIYADANIGISGVVNGLVTLYTPGSIVILDDIRYANDPVLGVCHDILGLISGMDVVVADNALNTPVPLEPTAASNFGFRSMDDSPGVFIHAVSMSLGTSFRVENWWNGPRAGLVCNGVNGGRGCLDLSGGLIQVARGAVGSDLRTGFTKVYTYDRCAVRNPPPYFPTTGRFIDNRYLELDPVGFNPGTYFRTLIPNTP
ncbi:MAG: hypothetical protein JWN79_971 [Gemmatimonadetes bacterium]|jgi:hypothetical protein|nr:hypothetical protein [Gemmatimonadota bacterium]